MIFPSALQTHNSVHCFDYATSWREMSWKLTQYTELQVCRAEGKSHVCSKPLLELWNRWMPHPYCECSYLADYILPDAAANCSSDAQKEKKSEYLRKHGSVTGTSTDIQSWSQTPHTAITGWTLAVGLPPLYSGTCLRVTFHIILGKNRN